MLARLRDLRDAARALSSFAPGQGYDAIGLELSDIVIKSGLNHAERVTLFQELEDHPDVWRDVQCISVMSELQLENHYADRIIADLHQRKNAAFSLNDCLSAYPYDWRSARLRYMLYLFARAQSFAPYALETFVHVGRSMLPFSALDMCHNNQVRYVWFDQNADYAGTAKRLIVELEQHHVLQPDRIVINPCADYASALQAVDHGIVFVQDDDAMTPSVFEVARRQNMPVILSETMGLARLLYPDRERCDPCNHGFAKDTLILARHAHDEPHAFPDVVVPADNTLYLSLGLYRPV
jgi:hypothetical protein